MSAMSSCWATMVEEKGTACGLIEFKGGSRTIARRRGVSSMVRHEGGRGQPIAGPRRGGTRQGKTGGGGFRARYGRAQKERGAGPGRKKRSGPCPE
jgi:hypothetical protein